MLGLLAGCAFSFPDYPQRWAPPMASTDACTQLTGAYLNAGERGEEDAYTPNWDPELRAFLFDRGAKVKDPERIELEFTDEGKLHLRAVGPPGLVAETWLSEADSTLTCTGEGAEIKAYSGITDTPGNPVVGYEHHSRLLMKARDGSLVVKSASGAFGLVYLFLPAGASEHAWYRFPAAE